MFSCSYETDKSTCHRSKYKIDKRARDRVLSGQRLLDSTNYYAPNDVTFGEIHHHSTTLSKYFFSPCFTSFI